MRKVLAVLILVSLAMVQHYVGGGVAQAKERPDGPWRIVYVEGGSYSDYWQSLQGFAQELQRQGIIEHGRVPLPVGDQSTRQMWEWLNEKAGGDQIVFLKDGFYSANWDKEARAKIAQDIATRVREKQDVDVVLAFGTWAGQDLAKLDIDVPVIVVSVTNAQEAGIIPSVEDSGRDNLTASIDPERYIQQVLLFHDIFRFKKLGIAYDNASSARGSIALGDIEKATAMLGVELVHCTDQFEIPDVKLASQRLQQCHQKLADADVDAVYITYNTGIRPGYVDDVLQPLVAAGIPTFSQAGSYEVEQGVLLSISQASFGEEGAFSARALIKIMNGALPRDLPQLMESSVSLSMNLRMATLIGWNPSLEILAAIDEIYRSMENSDSLHDHDSAESEIGE